MNLIITLAIHQFIVILSDKANRRTDERLDRPFKLLGDWGSKTGIFSKRSTIGQ